MSEVAYYDLAKKIVNILLIPNSVINTTVYPRIVQTKDKQFVRKVLYLRLGVAGFIYAGLLCFSTFIVNILGGEEMQMAVPVVNILGLFILLTAVDYYIGSSVLVAFNYGRVFNLSVVYSLGVYLTMIGVLISCNVVHLYSVIGVVLLNEFFLTAYRWHYCKKYSLI